MANRTTNPHPLRDANGRGPAIVEVAAQMFRERGYDGTSMADIAEPLGLLKGSVYHYISSKEELLYEVVMLTHQENLDLLELSTYPSDEPRVILEQFIRRNLAYIVKHPANVIAFDNEYRRLSDLHREEIVGLRKEYRTFLAGVIKRGQAQGVFPRGLNPKLLAILIVTMLISVARWYEDDNTWTADDVAAHCLALIQGFSGVAP